MVKYGLPVPPAKITRRPFSRCRIARSGMYGSATCAMLIAVWTRVGWPSPSSASCSASAVDHGGEHAHVVGAGAVHAARRAGHAAEDVAAADHDRDLDAEVAAGLRDLLRDAHDDLGVDAVADRLSANASPESLSTTRRYRLSGISGS